MSSSRQSSSPPTGLSTDLNPAGPEPSLRTSGRVTGPDGTVLVEVSRHTEHPAGEVPGGTGESPLVVIDVVGDIDGDTAPLLHTALTRAVRRNRRVCCDLSRVDFLGAAGVNTIVAAVHDADEAGCAFSVRGVHGISAGVFRLTGLDGFLAGRA